MDLEFHYYLTFIAARSIGYTYKESKIIANTAQYVDENQSKLSVYDGDKKIFENRMSQTFDLTLPQKERESIYTRFHFSPTYRNHKLQFVTNSKRSVAKDLMKKAITIADPYLIGVALHVFADSFAHEGFCGIKCKHNGFAGAELYGHTMAGECPDLVNLWWWHPKKKRFINNNQVFMDALRAIADNREIEDLAPLLDYQMQDMRIASYIDYVSVRWGDYLPPPSYEKWLDEAVYKHSGRNYPKHDFEDSHWYRFQLAVKKYDQLFDEHLAQQGCCLLI